MVTELMPRLRNADLWNGEGIPLASQTERGHSRHIRLEGEHHEVIDGPEIVARHRGGDVASGAFAVGFRDGGQRRVEPGIGPPRTDLRLTDRSEVLVKASFVRRSHLLLKPTHFREVVIKNAGFSAKRSPLGRYAPFRFLEQRREDFTATTQRGKLDPIRSPREGALRKRDLHRGVSRMLRGNLRHLLIYGDRIAIRRAEFSTCQPDRNTVVVMADGSRMMQTADRRDDPAVLFQRLE